MLGCQALPRSHQTIGPTAAPVLRSLPALVGIMAKAKKSSKKWAEKHPMVADSDNAHIKVALLPPHGEMRLCQHRLALTPAHRHLMDTSTRELHSITESVAKLQTAGRVSSNHARHVLPPPARLVLDLGTPRPLSMPLALLRDIAPRTNDRPRPETKGAVEALTSKFAGELKKRMQAILNAKEFSDESLRRHYFFEMKNTKKSGKS